MKRRRIQVEFYAGGRADEHPRRVIIGDRVHVIERLLSTSLEEDFDKRQRASRYRVLTGEGFEIEIIHASDGNWYLVSASYDTQS